MAGNSALWDTTWNTDSDGTMGDWALVDPENEASNIGGFQHTDDLGTAVLIALFTDARLPDWMVGQAGYMEGDQHTWHGNTFDIRAGEEQLGSYLYLIKRAPLNETVAKIAVHFAAEALQVLVRNKVVSSFEIDYELDKPHNRLNLVIKANVYGSSNQRLFVAELAALQ